jgi:hypothetical protein
MNLAAVWKLPVIFVCKDNAWAITTPAGTAVAGRLSDRARAFGLEAFEADGADPAAVWRAAAAALTRAREGKGPSFLRARCVHLEGHFLGDGLLDMVRRPLYSFRKRVPPLLKGLVRRGGAPLGRRLAAVGETLRLVASARGQSDRERDPLVRTRRTLAGEDPDRLAALEAGFDAAIERTVAEALGAEESGS